MGSKEVDGPACDCDCANGLISCLGCVDQSGCARGRSWMYLDMHLDGPNWHISRRDLCGSGQLMSLMYWLPAARSGIWSDNAVYASCTKDVRLAASSG